MQQKGANECEKHLYFARFTLLFNHDNIFIQLRNLMGTPLSETVTTNERFKGISAALWMFCLMFYTDTFSCAPA